VCRHDRSYESICPVTSTDSVWKASICGHTPLLSTYTGLPTVRTSILVRCFRIHTELGWLVFYVLLTVHLHAILGNDQLDALFLNVFISYASTCFEQQVLIIIQFGPPDDEHLLLETRRGVRNKYIKKEYIKLVITQNRLVRFQTGAGLFFSITSILPVGPTKLAIRYQEDEAEKHRNLAGARYTTCGALPPLFACF
jgi:hypothetical protein